MRRRAHIGLAYAAGVALGLGAAWQAGLFAGGASPAMAVDGGGSTRAPEDLAAAEQACAGGDGAACLRAAHARSHARAGKRDAAAVTALLERGCSLDEAAACGELGTAVREGDGVAADPARAFELVTRGCALGDAASCGAVAESHTRGKGAARDLDLAFAARTRACDLGDAQACDVIGDDIANGIVHAQDIPRGTALMTRACTLDSARCFNLAFAYIAGALGPQERVRGLELFVRACEAGDGPSCNNIGVLLLLHPELGELAGHALAPATVWFLRSCNQATSTGCANVSSANPLFLIPRAHPRPSHLSP